jgi:NADPH:quinone reductase-like Zn-dependent oxidoreductase
VCSSAKMEAVHALDAHQVIDYTSQDFADGSRSYDVILDVGGNTPVARLRRALTGGGRLVFVGGENGDDFTAGFGRQLGAFALAPFVKQRFFMLMAREHFESLERLSALIAAGKVVPLVDRRCSLSQVHRAIEALEAGKIRGKVVVTVSA